MPTPVSAICVTAILFSTKVELLIKAGANVNALANTDTDLDLYSYPNSHLMDRAPQEPCDTAWLLASQGQHSEIADLLLKHGAKPGRWKKNGWL